MEQGKVDLALEEKKKHDKPGVPYEKAIELTGTGKFHLGLLLLSGATITCTTSEILGPSYLLPAAQCDLHMSDMDKGVLGAIVYIGMICGSHFWGFMADTRGRRDVIRLTLFADAVMAVLGAFAPNYTLFVLLKFANGFFMTAPQAVAYAYLGEFHSPDRRARAFVWAGLFPALGLVLLPAVGWLVLPGAWRVSLPWVELAPWRLFSALCGLPSLLTAAGFCLLPESPKFLLSRGRADEALQVLAHVFSVNTGRPRSEYPVGVLLPSTSDSAAGDGPEVHEKSPGALLSVWRQTAPLFSRRHLLRTALCLFIMFGIIAGANGLPTWLPELFQRLALWESELIEADGAAGNSSFGVCASVEGLLNGGPSAPNATGGAAAAGAAVAAGAHSGCVAVVKEAVFVNNLYLGVAALLAPAVSVYFVVPLGKRTLLILSLLLTGACGIALNLVTSSLTFMVLSAMVVAVTEMCISLFSSIIVDLFPTHLRAMAVSLSLMCGRIGSIVGNFMFGTLLENVCPATFYALGGVLLLCAALALALPRRGKFAD